MKASLQLQMGQRLTLTPQVQQAIRLLQLSTIDLQQEIQENLESNPMLEVEPSADTSAESPVDTSWEMSCSSTTVKGASGTSGENLDLENLYTKTIDLRDHLYWQLELSHISDVDKEIAVSIIDAIDDNGMLTTSLEDLRDAFNQNQVEYLGLEKIDIEEIEAVLSRVQHFDPIGVGARNLRECLLIQLKQLPTDTPYLVEAREIIKKHIELLGTHNYRAIMRYLKLSKTELQHVVQLIKSLNPHPGEHISNKKPEYIVPDVIIRKINDRWQVELNQEALPRVRINNHYSSLVQRSNPSADNQFMKLYLQEARWFIKSLQSRHDTLLKVACAIVGRQYDFFEHGEEAMKPMVLNDIAEQLGVHESTISRVTTQKYMYTPRGVFELKYFFSSHLTTRSGGNCSSTAIRAVIKKLIGSEDPAKPLSDKKIAGVLDEQGINVARRTIAKYREMMNIPPSNERKNILMDND